jgi:uncharacterized protein
MVKMIVRKLQTIIEQKLFQGKALIILGPRQVGKSTLLNMISAGLKKDMLFLNCDNNDTRKQLSEPGINELRRIIGKSEIVFIDEAQRVLNIGLTLKLITDQMPEVQLIVTGSSSLELSNLVNEPLTGRKFEYQLFPLSFQEISNHYGYLEAKRNLHQFIVYGTYPDVVNNQGNESEVLSNLVSSYLFKDVFMYQDIRKPEFIEQLLEALALQMGSEVSFNELAQLLKSDPHTVQRYISLLEKAFIIFRLRSFSRNVRNELKKSRKIYFYDNGIRNAILGNYSQLDSRTDRGALWENFFIAERMKYLHYNKIYAKRFFWRTAQQMEIDYLEDYNGKLTAFEIKWNPLTKFKFPLSFTKNYPDAECISVHTDNFQDYLGV